MTKKSTFGSSLPANSLDNVADLYIRVSTAEQAEEGYSVGEQEARLRSYCSAMGFTVNAIHIDPGYSGATLNRPGINQVIKDVQSGSVKKVIVWKLDRLSRSQKDTLILLEDVFLAHGCGFISIMESFDTSTPFGRCIVGILAAFAQMERENIKLRTMMGKQARIRQGHFHGSHAPIGYKFCASSKESVSSNDLVIDPYTSKLVKKVYQLFLAGWSLNQIAKYMEASYSSQLYNWGHNTAIRRILSNPVYLGKVKSGNEWYDGIHEALVSEAEWNMAAAILQHNKELDKRTYSYKTSNGTMSDNLLTGLLFCGDCGARMYARKISKTNHLKRYICHSVARTSPAMIKSDHCTNRISIFTVSEMDTLVLNEIKKLAFDRSYFDSIANKATETDPHEAEIYKERLEEIKQQIERLINLYQTGLVGLEELKPRLDGLHQEKVQLEDQISDHSEILLETREAAWKAITSLQAVLADGDMKEVHRIVHLLIDRIIVFNADITIYWSFS